MNKLFRVASKINRISVEVESIRGFKGKLIRSLTSDKVSEVDPDAWMNDHLWLDTIFPEADGVTRSEIDKIKESIRELFEDAVDNRQMVKTPQAREDLIKSLQRKKRSIRARNFGEAWFTSDLPRMVDAVTDVMEELVNKHKGTIKGKESGDELLHRIFTTPVD